jgi:hypothetical protein
MLAFGYGDKISQKIVVVGQMFSLPQWQSTRLRRAKAARKKTDEGM